ncbi:MAG: hypothetical protein O3C63_05010 [Cyanobacteria bacterium]|nr:hypothetical protein [Cyanobacteriota bacterium]MDA1020457.1 hypothetical protein [Cyanobacteriota bacterium]
MELQEREKNIIAVFSVIVVICTYFFLLKPSQVAHKELKTKISNFQKELRNPQVDDEKIIAIEEAVNALKLEISTVKAQIPETEKRGFLIRDIETLAKKNNIEIISFLPKDAVPVTMTGRDITARDKKRNRRAGAMNLEEMHAKVLKTVINIDSSGRFEDYSRFFRDTITYYRAVEISDLIIAKGVAASGRGEDKRFSKKRNNDPLAAAKETSLNVNFTLLAYTSIPQE